MLKKRHKLQEIVTKLSQVYVLMSQGSPNFSSRHENSFLPIL